MERVDNNFIYIENILKIAAAWTIYYNKQFILCSSGIGDTFSVPLLLHLGTVTCTLACTWTCVLYLQPYTP